MKQTRTNLSTGIYVRVSTDEQVQEGFSIRAQIEKLKSYALLKDWDIFNIYADEGISGKNIVDRLAINKLIEDIQNGNVENVLVFKVDRLTRSTRNLLELVELFEQYNCTFNSLTESIDTDTPSGRMFLKIIGIFAEFERENLISRVKMGLERKVKEGYTLANNHVSYGYKKDKGQKVQEIDPYESIILKEIASMFLYEDMSFNSIARDLIKRKIPTKTGTGSWSATIIKQILTNPTYVGKVRYATDDTNKYFETDGKHESILSDELFFNIQEKIRNMQMVTRTKKPSEGNYFCGVLTCGLCGGKFTTHNYLCKSDDGSDEKRYKTSYRCRRQTVLKEDMKCKSHGISHDKVERAFIEYIQNINDITEDNGVDINESTQNAEQKILKSIIEVEKRISNLQTRKNHVMAQYIQGGIEFDEYKNMIKMFNENYDDLDNELQRKKAELTIATQAPEILHEDIITNLQQNWEYLSNTEKAIFLKRFIKKIIITVEKEKENTSFLRIERIEFHSGEPIRETVRSKMKTSNKYLR